MDESYDYIDTLVWSQRDTYLPAASLKLEFLNSVIGGYDLISRCSDVYF